MVALEKELSANRAAAPPPAAADAIPLSLRRSGGTPRQVLAMSVIGTLLLAVFAAPDLSSWLDRMGGGPMLEPLQNAAAEWEAAVARLGLTAPHEAIRAQCAGCWSGGGASAALSRRVRRDPVAGDVGAAADPDPVVAHDVLDKADQRRGAARMPGQAHVQPDRHHARPVGAFLVQQVEAVAQIGEEILARPETAAAEFHVVGRQRVRDHEMRLVRRTRTQYGSSSL